MFSSILILLFAFLKTRKTGHKKKVSSSVHFPEVLNMTELVHNPTCPVNDLVYNLTAVLIHRGPSAYSGHYIGQWRFTKFLMTRSPELLRSFCAAHIRDSATGDWYKFNDEVVQKLEGRNLKLGIEDDIEGM